MRISDWSSDVCSSDLRLAPLDLWSIAFGLTYNAELRAERRLRAGSIVEHEPDRYLRFTLPALRAAGIEARSDSDGLRFLRSVPKNERRKAEHPRSEERRVRKECGRTCSSRWSPYYK